MTPSCPAVIELAPVPPESIVFPVGPINADLASPTGVEIVGVAQTPGSAQVLVSVESVAPCTTRCLGSVTQTRSIEVVRPDGDKSAQLSYGSGAYPFTIVATTPAPHDWSDTVTVSVSGRVGAEELSAEHVLAVRLDAKEQSWIERVWDSWIARIAAALAAITAVGTAIGWLYRRWKPKPKDPPTPPVVVNVNGQPVVIDHPAADPPG